MGSKYQPVQDDEKFQDVFPPRRTSSSLSETTLLEDEEHARILPARGTRAYGPRWIWIAHATLLGLSLTMFVSSWFARVSTIDYVRHFSAYSPAVKAVEYETVKFNTTMGSASPYVGKGPEVDEAWHAISYDIGDQVITPEELKRIAMPESSLKAKHPKTGGEGYRVGLEVFHQLHCLNLLRQVTYKEHYMELGNGNFASGDEDLQMHTDHCLEILRMNVQCNADVGLFTFYMVENDPLPWPQLNSWHTCRNFDKVRDWALDNSVGNMERPDIHPEA
ncbi:Uncharacterized protein BP5553_00091 [Venustampulla echinocandica]|uniref:Tat pathway signal sequence n=1 Tax=Venustampulla echinocandica TaxID=2656787 RepID=A0A370TX57_9HELO|nr:Uncharacterized protein BP5553_00091 [Venustampulla echinocandica]RDL40112.1 Uncharacterized protein BP5553_00091 [Venustampulla echinocandica]